VDFRCMPEAGRWDRPGPPVASGRGWRPTDVDLRRGVRVLHDSRALGGPTLDGPGCAGGDPLAAASRGQGSGPGVVRRRLRPVGMVGRWCPRRRGLPRRGLCTEGDTRPVGPRRSGAPRPPGVLGGSARVPPGGPLPPPAPRRDAGLPGPVRGASARTDLRANAFTARTDLRANAPTPRPCGPAPPACLGRRRRSPRRC
jgi:hypothetical protein